MSTTKGTLLLVPTIWLVLDFLVNSASGNFAVDIVDHALLPVRLVCAPFALWALLRIVWPDFVDRMPTHRHWLIVAVVGGIVVIAYLVGVSQARFLTCDAFAISENSLPPACVQGSQVLLTGEGGGSRLAVAASTDLIRRILATHSARVRDAASVRLDSVGMSASIQARPRQMTRRSTGCG